MKTIYEAYKVKAIDEEILQLNQAIISQQIAKQQLMDNYLKQSKMITNQLANLLAVNDGHELSVLFNLPTASNRDILRCWVVDYLIEHETYQPHYSLTNMVQAFQSEVSVKQQDLYL